MSIDEDYRKRRGLSDTSAAHIQLLAIITVQSNVLLHELHPVVLENLAHQLAPLKRRPDHTDTGGVDHDPAKLQSQLRLRDRDKKQIPREVTSTHLFKSAGLGGSMTQVPSYCIYRYACNGKIDGILETWVRFSA